MHGQCELEHAWYVYIIPCIYNAVLSRKLYKIPCLFIYKDFTLEYIYIYYIYT